MDKATEEAVRHIENKTDENIIEVTKLSQKMTLLESQQKVLFKKLDDTKLDIQNLKEGQLVMSNHMISIKHSIDGNGAKGLFQVAQENTKHIAELSTSIMVLTENCNSHSGRRKDEREKIQEFTQFRAEVQASFKTVMFMLKLGIPALLGGSFLAIVTVAIRMNLAI